MHDRSMAGATRWLNKVPETTLSLWVIETLSNTVGETIDKALTVLRAGTPGQADCRATRAGLPRTFDAPLGRV
jgi:hypothetical protein